MVQSNTCIDWNQTVAAHPSNNIAPLRAALRQHQAATTTRLPAQQQPPVKSPINTCAFHTANTFDIYACIHPGNHV